MDYEQTIQWLMRRIESLEQTNAQQAQTINNQQQRLEQMTQIILGQPNPDPVQLSAQLNPVQLSAQPSAQVMAQSNAAAVEVMNNSTEVADLKTQIAVLNAQMAELEEKNATLAAENSKLQSEFASVKQDIKIVEQYEGINFQEVVDEVRAKDGQDYYEKVVKDLKIDN
jgi:cell division protein FtsB